MQSEILDRHKNADLQVFAIWFQMYPTDQRSAWPEDLLTDDRIAHFWDDGKVVGTWYAQRLDAMRPRLVPDATGLDQPVPVLWDSWIVYGPDALWEAFPTGLQTWGRTILNTRPQFTEAAERLFR